MKDCTWGREGEDPGGQSVRTSVVKSGNRGGGGIERVNSELSGKDRLGRP